MHKILMLILVLTISSFSYANELSKPEIDQKVQRLLEDRYNFSKEDFLRYSKNTDSRHLFLFVVLAHEANKPLDDILSFAKNYNKPSVLEGDIEFQIQTVIIIATILARETGHTYDEIMKMSDDGDPKKMDSLAKTLDVKQDRFKESLNEIRVKLNLKPKE